MPSRQIHLEANQEAERLLASAAVVRRHAGALRYHPARGLASPPRPELAAAIAGLRESLARIEKWMPAFAEADAASAADLWELRDADRRLRVQSDLIRSALDVLERALAQPERVPLDAPYGLGAPRRVHPGAQATWVAERAEALARELATQSVLRETLAADRAPSSP